MKLIFATYKAKWEKDILRSFYYLINILINEYDFTLVDLSDYELNSDFNTIISKYQNIESILVVENHDEKLINSHFNNFFENDIKKYIFADDVHKFKELKEKNYYEYFDKIFVTYYNPFIKLYPNIDISKIIWCPHSYTSDYLIDYNEQPINKIFLSGAMGLLYPTRKYMLKLFLNGYKDRISYLRHPGYKSFDYYVTTKSKVGKSYANLLNHHLCCFTDCLTYGFIVSKYFEIPASGSLLLAVNPKDDKLEKLGFIDEVNYISCTKENLKEKISWILDPKNKITVDKIRKSGMEMVRSKHSIEIRAKLINDHICN